MTDTHDRRVLSGCKCIIKSYVPIEITPPYLSLLLSCIAVCPDGNVLFISNDLIAENISVRVDGQGKRKGGGAVTRRKLNSLDDHFHNY
jgi:hypothetical protein